MLLFFFYEKKNSSSSGGGKRIEIHRWRSLPVSLDPYDREIYRTTKEVCSSSSLSSLLSLFSLPAYYIILQEKIKVMYCKYQGKDRSVIDVIVEESVTS